MMLIKKISIVNLGILIFTMSCGNSSQNKQIEVLEKAIQPVIITEPTLNDTDDPAIWYNAENPSESLVLGTDKGELNGGIYVFNLDGKIDRIRTVLNLKRPNNIDIEYGFNFKGQKMDIAVFTERGRNMIRVFSLPDMKAIDNGGIEVFKGEKFRLPMGLGLYKNPVDSSIYAIVSRKTGPVNGYLWQYILKTDKNGIVSAEKVREFGKFSGAKEIEAIAVDDELGYVYYSDETKGIRQYFASPDSTDQELSYFANTGFSGDQEGISIFSTNSNKGFILVSDQQANKFQIFKREGQPGNPFSHQFVKVIKVSAKESDGSDIISKNLGKTFEHGLFVVMSNNKTFHFYNVEDIF